MLKTSRKHFITFICLGSWGGGHVCHGELLLRSEGNLQESSSLLQPCGFWDGTQATGLAANTFTSSWTILLPTPASIWGACFHFFFKQINLLVSPSQRLYFVAYYKCFHFPTKPTLTPSPFLTHWSSYPDPCHLLIDKLFAGILNQRRDTLASQTEPQAYKILDLYKLELGTGAPGAEPP